MKIINTILLIVSTFMLFTSTINAQGMQPNAPISLPTPDQSDTDSNNQVTTVVEKDTNGFITGLAVGSSFGVIVGGILIWFIKDKLS